jgi:RNA polymerase sigma-70 factor (ECF subfamily)
VVRFYGLVYAMVGNRADAEDLTTEVFLVASGARRVYANRGEVHAYLAATTRTALVSHCDCRSGSR